MNESATSSKDARSGDLKQTSLAASHRELRLLLLVGVTFSVWLVFHFFLTDGYVLTARNLSTLSVQMTVTAILAIGMTLLLIAREIDLSAGAVMALIIVAIFQFQVPLGLTAWATVLLALGVGLIVGILHGLIRIWLLIPSFIITLAGFSWIRGLAFIIPDGQTLAGASDGFYAISNGELPVSLSGLLIIGLGGILLWPAMRRVADVRSKPRLTLWVELLLLAVGLVFVVGSLWTFMSHRGLPYPTMLLLAISLIVHAVLTSTSFGRHVLAVGGNPEAAKRVGIDVRRIIVSLFAVMGILTGIAAVIQSSLLDAGPPGIGELLALNAISAAIIGGTNLFGGQGSIPGTVAGALLMASISNGLSLAGVNTFYQMVATGLILLVAVGIDSLSRRREIRI